MFKDGGAVIPSGALHKNKHHLEEIDESLNKNITSKGIPVITIEDGGAIK
jgi:rRNA-processing protein FCF1